MTTIEERLTALEHDHEELKQKIELQTIAIGALVNKATLEKLNERYDKLFDVLIAHDRFTNEQLAELRSQQVGLDGKIVGMQTEMRQRFDRLETTVNEHTARFDRVEALLAQVLTRLPEKP